VTVDSLLGLAIGGGLAFGVVLLVAGMRGWRPRSGRRKRGPGLLVQVRGRAGWALAAAVAVGVVTRWPMAAGAAAVLVWLWPALFGGGQDSRQSIARIEALVTWTESLRDTIAGGAGLQQSIRHAAGAAPDAIQPQMRLLVRRLNELAPLDQALIEFGRDFQDGTAEQVVAALVANADLSGRGLGDMLTALAASGREELEMRRRVEESRRSLRRDVSIILGTTGALAGLLLVTAPDLMAPYSTVTGQLVLAIVIGVFAIGLRWLRRAAQIKPPERFLAADAPVLSTTRGRGW
jgi:tight adherence protein B